MAGETDQMKPGVLPIGKNLFDRPSIGTVTRAAAPLFSSRCAEPLATSLRVSEVIALGLGILTVKKG